MRDSSPLLLLEAAYRDIESNGLSRGLDTFCEALDANPGFLFALLRELTDDRVFATIRSSYHPIGFYSTVLSRHARKDYPSARFIWFEPGHALAEDIHDHAYDFSVIVVHGSIRERLFVERSHGVRYKKYKFDGTLLDSNVRTDVEEVACFSLQAGCRYQLDHDQLHMTAALTPAAALLMFRSSYRRFDSRVLALENKSEPSRQKDLSHDDFRSLVERVNQLSPVT